MTGAVLNYCPHCGELLDAGDFALDAMICHDGDDGNGCGWAGQVITTNPGKLVSVPSTKRPTVPEGTCRVCLKPFPTPKQAKEFRWHGGSGLCWARFGTACWRALKAGE